MPQQQPWDLVSDTNFASQPTTIAGGPRSLSGWGNGWIDWNGTYLRIDTNASNSTTVGSLVYLPSSHQGYDFFGVRPAVEQGVSSRILLTWTNFNAYTIQYRFPCFRLITAAGPRFGDCYQIGVGYKGPPVLYLLMIAQVGGHQLQPPSLAFDVVDGHQYLLDASVTGVNPTVLSATVTDLTASAVAATLTWTDSTPELQAAGRLGISGFSNSNSPQQIYVDRIATYSAPTFRGISRSRLQGA